MSETATPLVKSIATPLIVSCHLVADHLEVLKNSKITESSLNQLKISIISLVDIANSNLLTTFPIEIIDMPIDEIRFEIGGTYLPELKFTEMKIFAIDTLEQAERLSDVSLCLDALRVLINYANIVVFSRTDNSLVIRQKKLDDWSSSNKLVEPSTHVQNGDDSCTA